MQTINRIIRVLSFENVTPIGYSDRRAARGTRLPTWNEKYHTEQKNRFGSIINKLHWTTKTNQCNKYNYFAYSFSSTFFSAVPRDRCKTRYHRPFPWMDNGWPSFRNTVMMLPTTTTMIMVMMTTMAHIRSSDIYYWNVSVCHALAQLCRRSYAYVDGHVSLAFP